MARFGYLAVEKFGFINRSALRAAINEQCRQAWTRKGASDSLGKILVDKKLLTPDERDTILRAMMMEPNISWGEYTAFARSLRAGKSAKQAIGDYIGTKLAKQPTGITVFLSNSSTVFYAFLGMIKHEVDVNVLTINAAILAAYPSLRSKIRSVTTIWKGRVDLDNALIEPPDLGGPDAKAQFNFLYGPVTHALISVTGFDCEYGPMVDNAVARDVTRQALQSETHTYILMDHTKICVGADKNTPVLLFHRKKWYEIRERGNVEVVVTCHPQMPEKQASLKPVFRSMTDIKNILNQRGVSPSIIKDVGEYHKWSMRLRDILTEIPIEIPERGISPKAEETGGRDLNLLKEGKWEPVPKLEEAEERDPNISAFERELASFKAMLPRLMKTHPNQFVAILNGEVVDHDEDELDLTKRIYEKYPTQFVLVQQVREGVGSVSWLESPEGESWG